MTVVHAGLFFAGFSDIEYSSQSRMMSYRGYASVKLMQKFVRLTRTRMKITMYASVAALALAAHFGTAGAAIPKAVTPLDLPGVGSHAGFDDMGFIPALDRVIVPGGVSGKVFLIDPKSNVVSGSVRVLPPSKPQRGHDVGTTSAAYLDGYLIASDHDKQSLAVIDLDNGKVVSHVHLASGPDYVRFVMPVNQIWVTEPGAQQIQVFTPDLTSPHPTLHPVGAIAVKGGPEALVVDARSGRAYTNLWKRRTLVINVRTRKIIHSWKDDCRGPRGLALAPKHDLLFVGCTEGKAVALNLARHGAVLASAKTGRGVDIIAWNPRLQHLYVPAARSATLTVLALKDGKTLRPVDVLKVARGSHCVATDGMNKAYVCDPLNGRLLVYHDHGRMNH